MDSSLRVLWMAFTDQDKFEAMKTLSGHRTPRCDEHQFRAKMMVHEYSNHFWDIVVEHGQVAINEEKVTKMALLLPYIFAFTHVQKGWRLK